MRTRTKKIVAVLVIILILLSCLLIWYFLQGREYARLTLNNYLKTHFNNTLEIQSLSVNLNGLSVSGVYLELTPQITLKVPEIFIRISVFRLLSSGLVMSGAIKEISFVSPVLNISQEPETTSKSSKFTYRPYPLKPFSELKFIRRIKIQNAGISAGEDDIMLADSISGRIDLSDISNVSLSMIGGINKMPGALVEVDGALNLSEGSFLLVTNASSDNIRNWNISEDYEDLNITGGSVAVKLEARGSDDLRISGVVETDSVAFYVSDAVHITNGLLRGELFGSSMGMQGSFMINGVTLPFTADIPNILNLKWNAEIASVGIDLSTLKSQISAFPMIGGNIDFNSSFSGLNTDWQGSLSVKGADIMIEETEVDRFHINASLDPVGLRVNNLNAEIYEGDLSLEGLLTFSGNGSKINADYHREWRGDEALSIFKEDSIILDLQGRIERLKGAWCGDGKGELSGGNGSELLTCILKLKNGKLSSQIISPNEEGWLGLSLKAESGSLLYQLSTHDPHYALKKVLNQKYLPGFFHDYSINFGLDGGSKRFNVDFRWEYEDGIRGGLYQAEVYNLADGWSSNGSIQLLLDNGRTLGGLSEIDFRDGSLSIENLVLKDENDVQLLKAKLDYSTRENKLYFADCIARNLPAVSLIRFMKPDFALGCNSDLTTAIHGLNDSLVFDSRLLLHYPDGLDLTGVINGALVNHHLAFEKFVIVNEVEAKDIFTFDGEVDFAKDSMNSVIIRAVDFPVGKVFDVWGAPAYLSPAFDGRLNGRVELDGSLKHPDITSDVRLSNAVIKGNSGYWMNIRSVTEDSLYVLDQFDFGRDVLKLVDVEGNMNPYNSSYNFRFDAVDVDISDLIQVMSGKPGLITGKSNITMNLTGGDSMGIMETDVVVSSGQITPVLLNFDTLKSSFNITGFNKDSTTLLTVDSLSLNMDDSNGEFNGTIDLDKEGRIDIDGDFKGNLLGLLPRISRFVSNTGSYGEFSCRIGGNLSAPRLTQAQLNLRDGSMKLKAVVEQIDELNMDISLDTTGWIDIHQFTGEFNSTPSAFTNRRPKEMEESIVIGGYDLGIIGFRTDNEGVFAEIPGLMRKGWGGKFRFSGSDGKGDFEFHGPAVNPAGIGDVRLTNATLTYPFLKSGRKPTKAVRALLNLLKRMRWDAQLIPWQGCAYTREVSGMGGLMDVKSEFLDVDIKLYVDLLIDDSPEGLHFTGSLSDTLGINGKLTSTQGTVEYLDLSFEVDELGVIFNPVELHPIFYGNLSTEAYDSTGLPHLIRWVVRKKSQDISNIADAASASVQDRGRWGEITLVLEDDEGNSQEQILALLGYSPEGMSGKLAGLGSRFVTDITPLRRWEKDLERQVKRWLGVDRVDITSTIARNIVERQLSKPESEIEGIEDNYSYLRTLDHSRVTVGKYLTKGVFVSYTGSLLSEKDVYDVTRLGIVHDWDLMLRLYQIAPNLTLNYRYQYDSLSQDKDNSISLRFGYVFSLQDLIRVSR